MSFVITASVKVTQRQYVFLLVGYPHNFEKKRRENQSNNQTYKGNSHTDKGDNVHVEGSGNFYITHNVANNPVRYQNDAPNFI